MVTDVLLTSLSLNKDLIIFITVVEVEGVILPSFIMTDKTKFYKKEEVNQYPGIL